MHIHLFLSAVNKLKRIIKNTIGLRLVKTYPFFIKFGIAPKRIPKELLDEFTMNGSIAIKRWYINSIHYNKSPQIYTDKQVSQIMGQVKNDAIGGYGQTDLWLYKALNKYSIKGKSVAVMGSVFPWYESVVLCYGGFCTVIEHNEIISKCSRIKTLTPAEYSHNPIQFDMGLSISSFEHDGLGRYGDRLNPNGDLEAMAKMKLVIKPGGLLFLAVPIGKDTLVWNTHRIYGRKRFPLLINKWELLDSFGFENNSFDIEYSKMHGVQPIFVLKNMDHLPISCS